MAQKDRLSFSEACKELGISEDELEQLVAIGEITSMKEGDSFFFKPEAISQYKKNRKTEPTIILADEDMELLDVMEDVDAKTSSAAPPSARVTVRDEASEEAAAPQASGVDDILSFGDEETTLPTTDVGTGKAGKPTASREPTPAASGPAEDTVLNLDGLLEEDGSEATTPIPGAEAASKLADEASDLTVEGNVTDETLLDTDILELGEEEDSFKLDATAETAEQPTEATLLRGGGARAMQMKRKRSHAGFTAALVATVILLLGPLAVLVNTFHISALGERTSPPEGKPPVYAWILQANVASGVVEGIADLFSSAPAPRPRG